MSAKDWASCNEDEPTHSRFSKLNHLTTGHDVTIGWWMGTFPLFSDSGNKLTPWLGADGKFMCKMVWPVRVGPNTNIWRQLSNPMVNTSRGVRGYEKLIAVAGRPWNGAPAIHTITLDNK